MHRSSETIGRIAAALAMAQHDLHNPEKTQLGALPEPQGKSRSFRYASLAAGLDIIRKALGEREIATVQSTALDRELGLIRLHTVLAHSSGEWIASDWPVCPTTEVASPQRLGAALTYARRYALFTLVGIAGEDDLDAPDLDRKSVSPSANGRLGNGGAIYSPEKSATTRDELLEEVEKLQTLDDLTRWALRRLDGRRRLQADDAEVVDQAYLVKLVCAESNKDGEAARDKSPASRASRSELVVLPRTVRRRSKDHLAFVATQPCMVCKQTPCDAHHLKFAQPRALGRKVSDEFTVPLCRKHHSELHRHTNERAWWTNIGLSPLEHAAELWDVTQRGATAMSP